MRKRKPITTLLVTDRQGTTYALPPLPGLATPTVSQMGLFDGAWAEPFTDAVESIVEEAAERGPLAKLHLHLLARHQGLSNARREEE